MDDWTKTRVLARCLVQAIADQQELLNDLMAVGSALRQTLYDLDPGVQRLYEKNLGEAQEKLKPQAAEMRDCLAQILARLNDQEELIH